MSISRIRRTVLAVTVAAVSSSACAQKADFNEVGRQMAIMLQNSHFARLPFNSKLSEQFLNDYLGDLDYNRVYFTQTFHNRDDFRHIQRSQLLSASYAALQSAASRQW